MQAQSITRRLGPGDIPYCPWPYDHQGDVFVIRRHNVCGSQHFKTRPTDGAPMCAVCYPYYPHAPVPAELLTRTTRGSVTTARVNGEKGIWGRKDDRKRK